MEDLVKKLEAEVEALRRQANENAYTAVVCAERLKAARAEVDSLKEERDAAIAATDAALVRMSEERGIMDSNVRAAEARAAQAEQSMHGTAGQLGQALVRLQAIWRAVFDGYDMQSDLNSWDELLPAVAAVVAAKEQAEQALADCQRELRLQQPTIELPDKHPLRIRAEQAESALAARVAELEAERTSLVQHAQHYLPSWGTPQANEYSTQGEHERTWLIGAFNHLGGVRETLSAVVQSRDALAARVQELEAYNAQIKDDERAGIVWRDGVIEALQGEKDALAADNRALRERVEALGAALRSADAALEGLGAIVSGEISRDWADDYYADWLVYEAAKERIAAILTPSATRPPEAPEAGVCADCGHTKDNHPYRHPFRPVTFGRREAPKGGPR